MFGLKSSAAAAAPTLDPLFVAIFKYWLNNCLKMDYLISKLGLNVLHGLIKGKKKAIQIYFFFLFFNTHWLNIVISQYFTILGIWKCIKQKDWDLTKMGRRIWSELTLRQHLGWVRVDIDGPFWEGTTLILLCSDEHHKVQHLKFELIN